MWETFLNIQALSKKKPHRMLKICGNFQGKLKLAPDVNVNPFG